jgi:predicted AlkP superfamily pyrophosphatase or phosphodiesterase
MNWNNLTLQQFQEIHKLSTDTSLDEIEKVSRTICIIHGLTEMQVDDLAITEFNRLAAECKFLNTDAIPGKPVKSFRVGVKKYAINYKPTTLKHRQYVEILHFADKPVENMHLIMASLVNPVKWGFKKKNKAEDHEAIANDMLNAPLLPVYHSCVFFCKLFKGLIEHTQGFLIKEMMDKGATRKQAISLVASSLNAMDGFIQQSKSES